MELIYNNSNNTVTVYNLEDWKKLRKEYRIVGELLGSTRFAPALPMQLLPEEAMFLINKSIAKLVQYDSCSSTPTDECKAAQSQIQGELLREEINIYKEIRKRDIEYVTKKIIAGKRRKGDKRSEDEILHEELNKSVNVTEQNMIWPIPLESFLPIQGSKFCISTETLLSSTSNTRCRVYADLWERGYYVTSGNKFGGDFLVYLGDPTVFHAVYIIRCVESVEDSIHPSEIISFGRLGTSVKKKSVFAYIDQNETVCYISISWMESS